MKTTLETLSNFFGVIDQKMRISVIEENSDVTVNTAVETGIYIFNKIEGPTNTKGILMVENDGRLNQQWYGNGCIYLRTGEISATWVKTKASEADRLATSRTINGTYFNGSKDITTSIWGENREIKIGNTEKTINGGKNVEWSIEEIGALEKKSICQSDSENVMCKNINGIIYTTSIFLPDARNKVIKIIEIVVPNFGIYNTYIPYAKITKRYNKFDIYFEQASEEMIAALDNRIAQITYEIS